MSDEFTQSDWQRLETYLAASARWASLDVSIEEIAEDNKLLTRDLSRYDPAVAIPILASLLTLPKLQSHCIRLEILVVLAVLCCRGRKKANIVDAVRWFAQIGKSQCVAAEDPAEDVFVSLVRDRNGDYRLLEGVWEDAGFYTQRVLDVIATMPDAGQFGQIKKSVRALLIISDMVCEKAGVHRYQLGSDEHYSAISPRILPGRKALLSRVMITFADLDRHGITPAHIAPFSLHPQMRADLPSQKIGFSHLDRCPLIVHVVRIWGQIFNLDKWPAIVGELYCQACSCTLPFQQNMQEIEYEIRNALVVTKRFVKIKDLTPIFCPHFLWCHHSRSDRPVG